MNERKKRYPSPFTPLPAIARSTLPDQLTSTPARLIAKADVIAEIQSYSVDVPTLTITARITLPQKAGYARRLTNLLTSLRSSLEEEAPWLDDITITVSTEQ